MAHANNSMVYETQFARCSIFGNGIWNLKEKTGNSFGDFIQFKARNSLFIIAIIKGWREKRASTMTVPCSSICRIKSR